MFYKFTFDTVDVEIIHKALKLYFKLNDNDNLIERNRIRGLCQTISKIEPTEYLDMTFSEASKLYRMLYILRRCGKHTRKSIRIWGYTPLFNLRRNDYE